MAMILLAALPGCGGVPTNMTEGGTVVEDGSPLKAGTYTGTIECLRTFTDGSTEPSSQQWIVVIGDSGVPLASGYEIVPGMILSPPPNSTNPPETVLSVVVSDNAVVILTEFQLEATLCANICGFAFDGVCDDGFTGSATSLCQMGSDCFDCGEILVPVSGTKRSTYKVYTGMSIEYISSESATSSLSEVPETRDCTGILAF
jgi:hypothetical protein